MRKSVLQMWAEANEKVETITPARLVEEMDRRIVTVCDGGGNGTFTAVTLQELGYHNVATLEGGFYGWTGAGLPTVV